MNHNDILFASMGRSTYELGRDLYLKGLVRLESAKSFWRDQITVSAKIDGDGIETHHVTITINSGKIVSFRCSCLSENTRTGRLCAHGVAAAFAWIELMEHRKGESDRGISEMLKTYDDHRLQKTIEEYVAARSYSGQIQLIPYFGMEEGQLSLSFRIGIDRYYSIQDIQEFVETFRKGARYNYGSFLDFYHIKKAFTPDTFELLKILDEIDTYIWEHDTPGAKEQTYPCYMKGNSILIPGRLFLDRLIQCMKDPLIEADAILSKDGYVKIEKGNPELIFSLQYIDKGRPSLGARFSLAAEALGFCGQNNLYIVMGNHLWISDEETNEILGPVMELLTVNKDEECPGVHIGEGDLPSFCFGVLPLLRKAATVESGIDVHRYENHDLHTDFYFRLQRDLEITLEIKHHYGNISFNPVLGENPSISWRNIAEEKRIALLASDYFEKKYLDKGLLTTLDDQERSLVLLSEQFEPFRNLGEVHVAEELANIRVHAPKEIQFHVQASADWLDLVVNLEGMNLQELTQILKNYEEKQRVYHLKDGSFVLVDPDRMRIFEDLKDSLNMKPEELVSGKVHIPRSRAFYLKKLFEEHKIEYGQDEYFKRLIHTLDHQDQENMKIPESMKGTLRDYQITGFRWMNSLYELGFGGILADDMGLGKTIQTIALLARIYENPTHTRPSVVVCPASLIYNWKHEFRKFAPDLSTVIISGNGKERKKLLAEDPQEKIWITSYDMLRRDLEYYLQKSFEIQILDEAQYIKNNSTQTARAVKRIPAVCRFALTGTPVENNLSELWSIFDYLMPGYLYSRTRFHKTFEIPLAKENGEQVLKRLSNMTAPFILRRLKKQVLTELPDKCDTNLYLPLEGEQRKLYTAFALELKNTLSRETDEYYNQNKTTILGSLTRLREICCAPDLIDEKYSGQNAKLEALLELIHTCMEGDHPVLIFSQFTRVLSRIRYRLKLENIPCFMLTGHTENAKRQEMVERFQAGERKIFLISLKAGGTGLNLTKADTVVHFDPWWNVAAQNQATDRAHRIGQTREVNVYHLIASETIEENILMLQNAKQNLVDRIMTDHMVNLTDLTREQLLSLL